MKCFVPSCNNLSAFQNRRKRSNVVKVAFHCLAKDSDTRTLWFDILSIRALVIPERAGICSTHFEERSFYTKGSHVRSRLSALPRVCIILSIFNFYEYTKRIEQFFISTSEVHFYQKCTTYKNLIFYVFLKTGQLLVPLPYSWLNNKGRKRFDPTLLDKVLIDAAKIANTLAIHGDAKCLY